MDQKDIFSDGMAILDVSERLEAFQSRLKLWTSAADPRRRNTMCDFDDDGGSQFGQCGAKKAPHGNHLGLCQGQ